MSKTSIMEGYSLQINKYVPGLKSEEAEGIEMQKLKIRKTVQTAATRDYN